MEDLGKKVTSIFWKNLDLVGIFLSKISAFFGQNFINITQNISLGLHFWEFFQYKISEFWQIKDNLYISIVSIFLWYIEKFAFSSLETSILLSKLNSWCICVNSPQTIYENFLKVQTLHNISKTMEKLLIVVSMWMIFWITSSIVG